MFLRSHGYVLLRRLLDIVSGRERHNSNHEGRSGSSHRPTDLPPAPNAAYRAHARPSPRTPASSHHLAGLPHIQTATSPACADFWRIHRCAPHQFCQGQRPQPEPAGRCRTPPHQVYGVGMPSIFAARRNECLARRADHTHIRSYPILQPSIDETPPLPHPPPARDPPASNGVAPLNEDQGPHAHQLPTPTLTASCPAPPPPPPPRAGRDRLRFGFVDYCKSTFLSGCLYRRVPRREPRAVQGPPCLFSELQPNVWVLRPSGECNIAQPTARSTRPQPRPP